MKEKLKNLCLRILYHLIDVGRSDVDEDDKEIIRWLSASSNDIGFIRYIQMRERRIVKTLLVNGLENAPRDGFIRVNGQRFENHALFNRSQKARQILEKKREKKMKKK